MGTTQSRTVPTPLGDIRVRPATPDDAPAFILLRRHMARTSEHNVTTLDEVDTDPTKIRAWITDYLTNPGWLLLVADQVPAEPDHEPASPAQPHRLLGELSFRCGSRRRVQHHGDFGISVVQDWRGQGIGRALIQTLIDWATPHEFIEKIYLGVFESNLGARRLYSRLGFAKEGIRRDFFKLDTEEYVHDILMSRWVKPPPSSA